jgi:hypothetical protein
MGAKSIAQSDDITLAIRTASKSGWMTPLLGDAFFTSAIKPGFPAREMAGILMKYA